MSTYTKKMLHQIVFEYWSPSKEIRHQIELGQAFDALWSLKACLHRNYQEYYLDELKLFQPHTFEEFFSKRQLYHQFITFFGSYRLEGKTFKEALDLVKNDKCWYG